MDRSFTPNSFSQGIESYRIEKKEQKFEGFDILRAIFSIVIVGYKTKIFYIPKLLAPSILTNVLGDYLLSGMVGALAVPVFLQISLFIFYAKSKNQGFVYFIQRRLPRLVSLYLFWVISITLFDILFVGKFNVVTDTLSSVKSLVLFIVSGHSTPYFFFFSLIFVTVVAELLTLLLNRLEKPSVRKSISYSLLIASSLLVFAFATIEPIIKATGMQSSLLTVLNHLAGWDYNPLNFLPYAFTAAITMQEYSEGKLGNSTKFLKRKLYGLLTLTVLFFSLEWILTSNGLLIQVDQAPLDHYMRLSLVFGSWLLLYLALLIKHKASAAILFVSQCSLGIYGFHVFFIFKRPLPLGDLPWIGHFIQAVPALQSLTAFLITLVGAIALTLCFKRVKFIKRFV
ncbi:MAG: acyltransferase family protein [Kovacikia sp.]